MKFLVIVQDLKISGTSEGVVSRSFISRLRKTYPEAEIAVWYFKNIKSEDQLELLPVDSIEEIVVRRSPPKWVKVINHIYWRIYKASLNDHFLVSQYRRYLKKIEWKNYDHIFIRSAGNNFETILACKDLSLLKKAIINFHDPYPSFWDPGANQSFSDLDLNRLKNMWGVVQQARSCMTPSRTLSEDMEYLYGSSKRFFTLPHQYDPEVFGEVAGDNRSKPGKKVVISYQGAVQLGRNLDILLDAYLNLLDRKGYYKRETEFVLRITGPYREKIIKKYKHYPNLIFLNPVSFPESLYEKKYKTDILIVLENCAGRSNILPGKVPVIAFLKKPFLCLSPEISEMRRLLHEHKFVASCDDRDEIIQKLENLIEMVLKNKEFNQDPFKGYFGEENFSLRLQEILGNGSSF